MATQPVRSIDATDPDPDREVPVDPVDDDHPRATTALDELAAELRQDPNEVDGPAVLEVPAREGWSAAYSRDLDANQLERWRRASRDRKAADGMDLFALSQRILANQQVAIIRRGETLDDGGAPMTVRSRAFLDLIDAATPLEAVRKLYGRDGHVLAAANEVLSAAGYAETVDEVADDPTPARRRG